MDMPKKLFLVSDEALDALVKKYEQESIAALRKIDMLGNCGRYVIRWANGQHVIFDTAHYVVVRAAGTQKDIGRIYDTGR